MFVSAAHVMIVVNIITGLYNTQRVIPINMPQHAYTALTVHSSDSMCVIFTGKSKGVQQRASTDTASLSWSAFDQSAVIYAM